LDKKHEEDVEVVEKEIPFYLDKGLVDYFKGFHIDFVSGWISKRFLIVPTNGQVSNC
jgi:Fe-S cluster assembly iron-binding protein IscA